MLNILYWQCFKPENGSVLDRHRNYLLGAALCWGFEANQHIDVGNLISRYVLYDATGISGQALINIGNSYPDKTEANWNLFHRLLFNPGASIPDNINSEDFQNSINSLEYNLQLLLKSPITSEDAEIIKAEMTLAVNMAKLSCKIGLGRLDFSSKELKKVSPSTRKALSAEFENFIKEHQRLWTLRNRTGGLHKSVENLERGLKELQK